MRGMPRRVLASLLIALGVVALVAAFASGDDPVYKDDTFLDAESLGVLHMEGGDCFSDPVWSEADGQDIVEYTGCEPEADNQAYGFFQATDGPWDRERVAAEAEKGCETGFTTYWKSGESGLDFYAVLPTERTWTESEDRTVMCVVYNPRGELAGSPLPLQ
jgi:hypothetical protein